MGHQARSPERGEMLTVADIYQTLTGEALPPKNHESSFPELDDLKRQLAVLLRQLSLAESAAVEARRLSATENSDENDDLLGDPDARNQAEAESRLAIQAIINQIENDWCAALKQLAMDLINRNKYPKLHISKIPQDEGELQEHVRKIAAVLDFSAQLRRLFHNNTNSQLARTANMVKERLNDFFMMNHDLESMLPPLENDATHSPQP